MPYTNKRIAVETDLTPAERHQLKVRAVAEDVSVKALVTKALRQYLSTSIDKRHKHV
jgi:hypothetical protein